jgi:uncharacterized protein (TIGR02594 family)
VYVKTTPFEIAQRFVGVKEVPGAGDDPQVLAMLRLDQAWPEGDEVPWCSAFVNYVCWLLRLPRSKSLRARSWLRVGRPIPIEQAMPGFDLVIFSRGQGEQPGPDVVDAPGHVGFYAGATRDGDVIHVLGGNQDDAVCVRGYPADRVLGARRLA